MRTLKTVLVTAVFVLGFAGMASAVPTISVEFGGSATATAISSSSVITAQVFIDLTGDANGTNGYAMSVSWDTNYLILTNAIELPNLTFNATVGACDTGGPGTGLCENSAFEAVSFAGNQNGGTKFQIGTLVFHHTGLNGATNVDPFFFTGEAILDNNVSYNPVNMVGGTVIHPVPEPGTAALLALGLGALTVAGRRRRA